MQAPEYSRDQAAQAPALTQTANTSVKAEQIRHRGVRGILDSMVQGRSWPSGCLRNGLPFDAKTMRM